MKIIIAVLAIALLLTLPVLADNDSSDDDSRLGRGRGGPQVEIICPDEENGLDEPMRLNLRNGKIRRIRNATLRAVAQLACDNAARIDDDDSAAAPPPPSIFCGGFANIPCPDGLVCIDDPSDNCDPTQGGADCGGICVTDAGAGTGR